MRNALDPEAATWLACLRASGRRPATLTQYAYALNYLSEHLGRPLGTCERADAVGWVESLRFRYKPGSVAAFVRVAKSFFRYLINEEVIVKSPFERIKVTVPEEVRPAMTEDDIEAMSAKAKDARDRALLHLLVATGCRKGEAAALQMGDVRPGRHSTVRVPSIPASKCVSMPQMT